MNREAGDAEDRLAQRFAEFVTMLQQGIAIDVEQVCKEEPELRAQLQEALQLARDIANPLARRVPEIPGFQLLRPLGQGSSSTVWLALQQSLSREVALKVVHLDTLPTQSARERCLREARTMARIHDARVVAVHDVIEHGQWLAIAMDHVDGPNLRAVLREIQAHGDQPPTTTVSAMLGCDKKSFATSWSGWVVRQGIRLARALAGLHAHGLVHRDVKPENVLLTHEGETVLADLGLARAASELTAIGFSGTPFYAAPEQWRQDAQLDGRADIYSLGVLLYELLALAMPLERGHRPASRPQPLPLLRSRARHVNRDLATVVHKAIELDPDRRYEDINAFADDLERVVGLLPILASPPTLLWRSVRFAQRHRRGAIAVGLGVALAVAAFVPFLDALEQQLRAPILAAESMTDARALVFDVIASRGEPDTHHDATGDLDAAAKLRSAVARYDASLAHRDDASLRRERDIAQLAASLLEARRGDFPPQLAASVDGGGEAITQAQKRLRAVAIRWLSGLETLPSAQQGIQDSTELTSLGLLACLLGDLAGCEEHWNRLDPMAPTTPLVDVGRGILLAADDRHDRALPSLLRAASEFPDDDKITLRLADAAVRGGNKELARSALARMPETARQASPEADRIGADILRLQGDTSAARIVYERLARANKDAWLPRARIAAIDLENGKDEEAISQLRALVEMRPDAAWLRLELARAAIKTGKLDLYVEQARFAVARASTRRRLSHGTARSLAKILEIGGVFDSSAPAQLRMERGATLAITTPSIALSVADQETRERLAAVLGRLIAFDRDAWPTTNGRERGAMLAISNATRATIAGQDLLVHASPAHGAALAVAAHLARHAGQSAVRDGIAHAWLLCSRIFDHGRDRILPLAGPILDGQCGGIAVLRCDERERLAVVTRVAEQPRGVSYLRAVTPFGIAASASLRLSLLGADGNAVAPGKTIGSPVSMLNAQCTQADDLDGDGCEDLVVVHATLGESPGACTAVSGRTGTTLWTRTAGSARQTAPWSLAVVTDLDADSVSDIALGLPDLTHPLSPTYNLELVSGKSGATLTTLTGPASSYFGFALARSDARLAIGCPHRHAEPGCVELFELSRIHEATATTTLRAPDATPGFGRTLATLPDLDGDGHCELAISDAAPTPGADERSRVWIVSTTTGRTLWTAVSRSEADGFGSCMLAAEDHDGDGVADVWIAAPSGDVGACGEITLHSGANGRLLRRIRGHAPGAQLGLRLFAIGAPSARAMALGNGSDGSALLFALETRDLSPANGFDGAAVDRTK